MLGKDITSSRARVQPLQMPAFEAHRVKRVFDSDRGHGQPGKEAWCAKSSEVGVQCVSAHQAFASMAQLQVTQGSDEWGDSGGKKCNCSPECTNQGSTGRW